MLTYDVFVLFANGLFGVLMSVERVSKLPWREGDKSGIERGGASSQSGKGKTSWLICRGEAAIPLLLDAPASNQVAATWVPVREFSARV